MVYVNKQLLTLLERELTYSNGDRFEKFIAYLLTRKVGKTVWLPQDGNDGGIDFASKDILFQIYGAESPGGGLSYMRKKLGAVATMLKTAKENDLTATTIVFVTNLHPSTTMAKLFARFESEKLIIMDYKKTAEYLYTVFYPFAELQEYFEEKCSTIGGKWPYDISEETFVDNFDYVHGRRNIHAKCSSGKCLQFLNKAVLHGLVVCAGFYGMGKTSITKIFFKKWESSSIYPIYVNLAYKKLETFEENELGNHLMQEIISCLSQDRPKHNAALLFFDDDLIKKMFKEWCNKGNY